MTKEEIQKISHIITYSHQRTVITMQSGKKLIGYFEKNGDSYLNNDNNWNFVKIPNENSVDVELINGDDIIKIEIINLNL